MKTLWFFVELKAPVGQIFHCDKTVLAVEQNKVFVPPSYTKCVAWGFADHSLRIGNYESEKPTFVSEAMQNGEIIACVCPSAKMIVTAGTSSVSVFKVLACTLYRIGNICICYFYLYMFVKVRL